MVECALLTQSVSLNACSHRHEIENGRTSSISEHTVGITQDGRFRSTDEFESNDFCDDDEEDDGANAGDAQSLITFSDLAGHEKYLKITASGLASQFPDYAMLVVDSTKGVQPMTREHIKIATALEVAICVVMTKIDAASAERIQQSVDEVAALLRLCSPTKTLCTYQRAMSLRGGTGADSQNSSDEATIPLLLVSNLTGEGLDGVQAYLAGLEPKRVRSCERRCLHRTAVRLTLLAGRHGRRRTRPQWSSRSTRRTTSKTLGRS